MMADKTWRVPLADIDLGSEEENAVLKVIQSRWLTMGEVTNEFEHQFADYVGAQHAVAVTNGTAALHLACLALGVGPGDEVVLPSLTFVASAAAIRHVGAKPVFADITSEEDPTISPSDIEQRITERTKAIMLMHYGGYACDMPGIMDLADGHGLAVIEDAAHAPGAELDGIRLGTWGDIGCFSFFSNKNMATGEGGMLVTNDEGMAKQLRLLRSHGMTSVTWDRHRGHAFSYDVITLGYNYRIDEIRATIGIAQLQKLDAANEQRRRLSAYYHQRLAKALPSLTLPLQSHSGTSSAHLMPILLPRGADRSRFMEALKDQGIQSSVHYPPIHRFTDYVQLATPGESVSLPVTEDLAEREVTLPLYATLSKVKVDLVIEAAVHAVRETMPAAD